MSHTTTVKADIKSATAIVKAAEELIAAGLPVTLERDTVPRMYFPHQHPQKSDFVLKLKGSRYDVGIDKQADGTYALAFDAWGGDINKILGNPLAKGPGQTVAKFTQCYTKYAAIEAAQKKGYTVTGCRVDSKGAVHVNVLVP